MIQDTYLVNDCMHMYITLSRWHEDYDLRWNRSQLVAIDVKTGPTYVEQSVVCINYILFCVY